MSRPKISALIHTRNESAFIDACLESVAWADEVIVADMASTDDTRAKAAARGARIIDMPVVPYVDTVRNQALAACAGDWILVVDADETVPPMLATRLRELAAAPTADAYALPRRNYFLGVWVEHIFWPDHQTRFFRRGVAAWDGVVHHAPEVQGRMETLPADPARALEHPGYGNDVHRMLVKTVNYTQFEVERLKALAPAPWPYLLRRPISEFIGRYFGGGWRHGMHGLVLSLILTAYQLFAAIQYWAAIRGTAAAPSSGALRGAVRWEAWRTAVKLLRF